MPSFFISFSVRISTSTPSCFELLGLGGEFDRAEHVGRLVDEVARQHDAVGDGLGVGKGLLRGRRIGALDGELRRLLVGGLAVVVVLLRLVLVEGIGAQQDARGDARGFGRRRSPRSGEVEAPRSPRPPCGTGAAMVPPSFSQSYSVSAAVLPSADHHEAVEPAPCGATMSSAAPILPVKSATGERAVDAPAGSQALAASLRPPPSADRTNDAALFRRRRAWRRRSSVWRSCRSCQDFGRRKSVPGRWEEAIVADIWRFCAVWQDNRARHGAHDCGQQSSG